MPGLLATYAEQAGRVVWREGFPDRAYDAAGRLVDRSVPGAVLVDEDAIVAHALALADSVDSLCLHGDNPGAVAHARAVREGSRGGRMGRSRPLNVVHRRWRNHVENHVEKPSNLWTYPAVLWSKLWDQKNVEFSSTNPLRSSRRRA